MQFNNEDLIITDPCYVIKDSDYHKWLDSDVFTRYGDNNEGESTIGGMTFEWSDTIYGDWSCTTLDNNDNELGHFCADAGLVGIFKAEEIYKYNPEFFREFFLKDWCVTLISNFTGEVHIEEVPIEGYDEGEIRVIGTGSINFYTTQTGL